MKQCKKCKSYISKEARYCKECVDKRKDKIKVSPRFLNRGEIRYAGHRSLYDK